MALASPSEKTVLIADDNVDIVHLLTLAVSSAGFRTASAGDGQETMEVVEKSPPHAVILDLMMPRYGGFEVLKALQQGNFARIPIIVITAHHADPSTVDMIRQESNVVAFFKKPVNLQELIRVLHEKLRTQPIPEESKRGTLK